MNTEITKYKNITDNDLLENRLLKLENQIQDLARSDSYRLSYSYPVTNNFRTVNLQNNTRGNLSLSEGQMAAQMAIAMSRSSQRNS